ncbi:MAG TPA: glutamate synthase central domain-containing protein, partial [Kiritimatiellia bacterium]|nr:glutamate synthase central domain-containing protein [Kiritimatiellia bacterium]
MELRCLTDRGQRRHPFWRKAGPRGEGRFVFTQRGRALDDIRDAASKAIEDGARVLVISDRESNENLAPIPSLLSVAAIHHHLVR